MNSLMILDDIFGFEGGGLDLILFTYLKRALKATDSQFGIFLVFEKDGKLSSMARIGEFSERKKIEERAKGRGGILPIVLETMEPYIANDLDSDPFHISFREEKVGSEIEYPFYLKDGGRAVLILLSHEKNHFKEKHLEELKRIELELTSLIDKLEKGLTKRGIIFFDFKDFGNFLEEIIPSEFEIYRTKDIKEIQEILKENHMEFIFKECNLRCSKECKEIFFLSRETFIPIGILRPFTFHNKKSCSFSCSIYSPLSLSPIQENIRDLIRESKYHVASEKWQFENLSTLNIAFVQKHIIENHIEKSMVRSISRHFNFSPPHLSRTFRAITGIKLKEFLDKIKMCNALFQLIDERPVDKVALLSGYNDRFTFCKAFKRVFGFAPSQVKSTVFG